MKLVLQRVARASVSVNGRTVADISKGLLILFGAEKQDNPGKVLVLADKALNLRIFPDNQGMMNLSCLDISGKILRFKALNLRIFPEISRQERFIIPWLSGKILRFKALSARTSTLPGLSCFSAPNKISRPLEISATVLPLTETEARATLCRTSFITSQRARKKRVSEPSVPIRTFTSAKHFGQRPS